jgi:hypothetical protein
MPFKKGETPTSAAVFEPGVSGNPAGRPKGLISQLVREYGKVAELQVTIEKVDQAGKNTRYSSDLSTGPQTVNQTISVRRLQIALAGDIKAIREVLNRTEGRIPLPVGVRRDANAGAELKVWTAEEVDRYEEWLTSQTPQTDLPEEAIG